MKKIIAVGSGKGGVGKSLISSLLGIKLQKEGYKVGILDADLTGPSISNIFKITEKPKIEEKIIYPFISKLGLKIISLNMLLEHDDDPTIWRGPLLSNVLLELYNNTNWGELDYLIIDMPPGTSDIAITVYQSFSLEGVIVVTTPEHLVKVIIKKFYNMTKKMKIKILGIIENMSYLKCEHCLTKINLFGDSQIDQLALELGIKVLGKIPLDSKINDWINNKSLEEYPLEDILKLIKFKGGK